MRSDRAAQTPMALAGRRILAIDDNVDAYRAHRPEVVLLDIDLVKPAEIPALQALLGACAAPERSWRGVTQSGLNDSELVRP